MPRNTLSGNHGDSEAKFGTYKYTEIGLVLDVKVICHTNVYAMRFRSPEHL